MMTAAAGRGWRWPLVLLAVCAVLATAVAAIVANDAPVDRDMAGAGGTPPTTAVRGPEPDEPAVKPFQMPPAHAFSTVTDRPLFHSSRRPIVSASQDGGETVSGDKPAMLLRGTIVIADGERIALFEAEGKQKAVSLGGDISGWVVVAVEPERVVIEHRGSQAVYSLDETLRKAALQARETSVEQRRRAIAESRARRREEDRENDILSEE